MARQARRGGSILRRRASRAQRLTDFQKAYGFANRELQVPNTLDTRFNIASIGKLFTSAAIARLVRDGRLSYSDTIARWLPATKIPSADRITVAQLLDMTSGLGDIFGPAYAATPKDRIQELSDYLALFETRPLSFEPGTGREYSNAGYVVLGLIIEKITGKTYREFAREAVFLPAGMSDTGLFATDEITPRRAVGYIRHEGDAPGSSGPRRSNIFLQPGRGSSAGGGFSTAGDLLKFAMALKKGDLSLAEPGGTPGAAHRGGRIRRGRAGQQRAPGVQRRRLARRDRPRQRRSATRRENRKPARPVDGDEVGQTPLPPSPRAGRGGGGGDKKTPLM